MPRDRLRPEAPPVPDVRSTDDRQVPLPGRDEIIRLALGGDHPGEPSLEWLLDRIEGRR